MALTFKSNPESYLGRMSRLKKLFWLFFLLLVFEGALRKWVAPHEWSAPLMIIRDPLSIWIVWEAYRTHKWPHRWSALLAAATVLVVGLFVLQIVFGETPFLVELFGLRSYLLPFPVLFIMGENLDEEDLHQLGAFILRLLPPMALLEVAQYISPPGSFLNRGAYEGAGQIGYAGGHVRASGTFSFNVGSESLAAMAAAFLLYFMVKEGVVKKWQLWIGTFALILSIPMIGARTLVFVLAAMLGCMAMAAIMDLSNFVKVLRIFGPAVILMFGVSLLPVFKDATNSLSERFAGAKSGAEGDPLHSVTFRIITPIVDRLESTDLENNWLGNGIGRSAIAVQAFLTGETVWLAGEDDFAHVIWEFGPPLGLAYELFRVLVAVLILGSAFARARDQQPLALLLVPVAVPALLISTPEQTTVQGFIVLSCALCIAAGRLPMPDVGPPSAPVTPPYHMLNRRRIQRNQSI